MNTEIKYALISEGTSDVYSIKIICNRLALLENLIIDIDENLSHPANGPISESTVRIRIKQFSLSNISFGVCLSDADRNKYVKKIASLKNMIERADPAWHNRVVVGAPCRNLEAWLLADEDCVKKCLSLNGTASVPFGSEDDPKNRLLKLAGEYGDDSLTPKDLREQLAKQMDLSIAARRNKSFFRFKDDFLRMLRTL